jgi:hypothetical protein
MSTSAPRQRLRNRRPHWLYRFECDGQIYTGGIGRFDDGRIAEIFINGAKVGTAARSRPSATRWLDPEARPVRWRRSWERSSHEAARTSGLPHTDSL